MTEDFDSEEWERIAKHIKKINHNKRSIVNNKSKEIAKQSEEKINYLKYLDDLKNADDSFIAYNQAEFSAIIDLHGLTIEDAFAKLKKFIHESYHKSYRDVLIITGKSNKHEDSLYIQVPKWLRLSPDISTYVSFFKRAGMHNGGEGALEVKVKKIKL